MSENEIEVESNIPIPISRPRPNTYPWHKMKVGDSFLIKAASLHVVSSAAGYASKKYSPKKFACRTVADGIRVWRIEDVTK